MLIHIFSLFRFPIPLQVSWAIDILIPKIWIWTWSLSARMRMEPKTKYECLWQGWLELVIPLCFYLMMPWLWVTWQKYFVKYRVMCILSKGRFKNMANLKMEHQIKKKKKLGWSKKNGPGLDLHQTYQSSTQPAPCPAQPIEALQELWTSWWLSPKPEYKGWVQMAWFQHLRNVLSGAARTSPKNIYLSPSRSLSLPSLLSLFSSPSFSLPTVLSPILTLLSPLSSLHSSPHYRSTVVTWTHLHAAQTRQNASSTPLEMQTPRPPTINGNPSLRIRGKKWKKIWKYIQERKLERKERKQGRKNGRKKKMENVEHWKVETEERERERSPS